MMNCQDVGDHHDHHGDVEREQGAEDEEVLVVHLTHGARGHDVLHVQEGEDRDGGGQEDAQHLGDEVSIGIVYSDIMGTQVRTIL